MTFRTCYSNVSDLAVCQKCPVLFGYMIHRHEPGVWQIGIRGKGSAYGSMFHKNIARVFFEAASNSNSSLHSALSRALSQDSAALEDFIRENIFMPFIERCSSQYTPEQIMAAALGVRVWVRAMQEFFSEIPSLKRNVAGNMSVIFLEPEQKLQASYEFPHEGRLIVTGKYDALMFNPDKAEARLFEFKGYSKTDAAVPLSQSIIYAWLIERYSGIVPSVEIIYLDEQDRKPDIFDSASVKHMIRAGLPRLFYAAFNTITLRRLPKIMRDEKLCSVCRFNKVCETDWREKFRKRRAASLVNVMVFMAASVMISTHLFFFSELASQSRIVQAETLQKKFSADKKVNDAINLLKGSALNAKLLSGDEEAAYANKAVIGRNIFSPTASQDIANYQSFDKVARINSSEDVRIYDLDYTLIHTNEYTTSGGRHPFASVKAPYKIFAPMKPSGNTRYFLIRVLTPENTAGKNLMYQILVKRTGSASPYDVKPLTFEEVWWE